MPVCGVGPRSGVAQWLQNRASGRLTVPQFGHAISSGAAQLEQNRAASLLDAPHWGQDLLIAVS
jgi:hypothetical protein